MTGGLPPWTVPAPGMASRPLPIRVLPAGTPVVRIHHALHHPHYFGRTSAPRKTGARPRQPTFTPRHRFDDAAGEFGVCYVGLSDAAAFAETVLRDQVLHDLSRSDLERLAIADGALARAVRVVEFGGAGLHALQTVAGSVHAPYQVTRAWARAFWNHADRPCGILYHSRYDNEQVCVALFDRAAEALSIAPGRALPDVPHRLGPLLDRWQLAYHL